MIEATVWMITETTRRRPGRKAHLLGPQGVTACGQLKASTASFTPAPEGTSQCTYCKQRSYDSKEVAATGDKQFGDPRVSEAFWAYVHPEPNTGCWLWAAGHDKNGYGKYNGEPAHRYGYLRAVGPVAPGLELDHLCRQTACVNPNHLEPVTRAENMRRRYEALTHCVNGHKFDSTNTYRKPSDGLRQCRQCSRDSGQRYRDRQRKRRRQAQVRSAA